MENLAKLLLWQQNNLGRKKKKKDGDSENVCTLHRTRHLRLVLRKFEKKQELRLASLLEGRTNELSVVPYALALSYGIENAAGRQGVKVTFFLSKNLGGICAHVNKQAEARKARNTCGIWHNLQAALFTFFSTPVHFLRPHYTKNGLLIK